MFRVKQINIEWKQNQNQNQKTNEWFREIGEYGLPFSLKKKCRKKQIYVNQLEYYVYVWYVNVIIAILNTSNIMRGKFCGIIIVEGDGSIWQNDLLSKKWNFSIKCSNRNGMCSVFLIKCWYIFVGTSRNKPKIRHTYTVYTL